MECFAPTVVMQRKRGFVFRHHMGSFHRADGIAHRLNEIDPRTPVASDLKSSPCFLPLFSLACFEERVVEIRESSDASVRGGSAFEE